MDAITAKRRVPEFAPGDTVKVMVKVIEDAEDAKAKKKGAAAKKDEDKGPGFRLQAYEGVVIARSGGGINESFTVRKISYGEGVERVFPVYSPYIAEIEVLRRGKVRRAKLYYLRGRRGKSARIFERTDARAKRLNAAFKGFKRPKGEADDLTQIKGVTRGAGGPAQRPRRHQVRPDRQLLRRRHRQRRRDALPRRPHREGRLGAPGAGAGGRGRRRRAAGRGRGEGRQEVGRNSASGVLRRSSAMQLNQYGAIRLSATAPYASRQHDGLRRGAAADHVGGLVGQHHGRRR